MSTIEELWDRWLALSAHPLVLALVGIGSVLVFVLALLGVPWVVARLPADHFARDRKHPPGPATPVRVALRVLKNVAAVLLLLAGIAMLFLPGQGLLTMLVALGLMDIPGKHRLQQRLLRFRPVHAALDAIRRRAGREPLILDPPRHRD